MMHRRASPIRRRHGVALVIVLAFIVLIAGLVIAFFSRAINERDISNSSADQMQVTLFTTGAASQIVGDLKQELQAGSVVPGNVPSGNKLYLPAGPYSVGVNPGGKVNGAPPVHPPNVVKRSIAGEAFFDNTGSALSSYPSGTPTPANGRACTIPTPNGRTPGGTTTYPSLNGRFVSLERWNKPLLIPTTSDTSQVPAISGSLGVTGGGQPTNWTYAAPDWVLMARDGTNPTSWKASMKWTPNTLTTVVGRYAYTIYDEGGMLDINAAGYPLNSDGTPAANAAPGDVGRKGLLAFADLTQLHTLGHVGLTPAEVGGLLGWRNEGTLGVASMTYGVSMLANPSGFLRVNTPVGATGNDRAFVSRQQLIDYVQQKMGNSPAAHDALQYMTTFSRDTNQPSLAPVHAQPPPFVSFYSPPLPALLPAANGGNDQTPANTSTYNALNPVFLSLNLRFASSPYTRLPDSVISNQHDFAVRKRFPLNRLAWLTYKGPSAGRSLTDPDMVALVNAGISPALISQGTDLNIQYYFGLQWQAAGYWKCIHTTGAGVIQSVSDVAGAVNGARHEPDFLELLKAAITTGALGKSATYALTPVNTDATISQGYRDRSVDTQVLQIAANIIDQFDVDGYPTRIQRSISPYSNPPVIQEVRGVENLPYLYSVRNAAWRVVDANTMPPLDPKLQKQSLVAPAASGGTPGYAIMVQIPEVWNPHFYDTSVSTNPPPGLTPTGLGVAAYSGLPAQATTGNSSPNYLGQAAVPVNVAVRSTVYSGAGSTFGDARENSPAGAARTLSAANTLLKFSNAASAYREPTLLIKPGTNVTDATVFQNTVKTDLGISSLAIRGTPTVYSGSDPSPGNFAGIYLGKGPVEWPSTVGTPHTDVAAGLRMDTSAGVVATTPPVLTYQLLCDNPNSPGSLMVYDEKSFLSEGYTTPITQTLMYSPANPPPAASGDYQAQMLGGNRLMTCFDPRTSRFGMQTSNLLENTDPTYVYDFPPNHPGTTRWLDTNGGIVPSNRPDIDAGYGAVASPMAPLPGSPGPQGWTWDGKMLRYGIFALNSPSSSSGGPGYGPGGGLSGDGSAQYYADPDGVVRRGSGAYAAPNNSMVGDPLAIAYTSPADVRQRESRPIILNRPFRGVGELDYVFSDTPWKNLDFSTPESGYAGLLDVFCLTDEDNADGLVAGRVNLNTRQIPVLQAILAGAFRDEEFGGAQVPALGGGDSGDAHTIASLLVQRTLPGGTTNAGTASAPLSNVSELAGRWIGGSTPTDGSTSYDGFSADLKNSDKYINNIDRYRDAAIRALASVGTTRTWNLMIDVIAQIGRYPINATGADQFLVEGEQRCWLHVAIDRSTGKIIDQQLEVVRE